MAQIEAITESVNNLSINAAGAGDGGYKKNRIQVSNTKKPLFFYVNLAKKYMQNYNEVELSALGMENGSDELSFGDGLVSDASDDEVANEWKWRHKKFHTLGYRDGITEGKKVSAQEGFNAGFKQSANYGYRWGLVRGITSALIALPDCSKEKLVSKIQNRDGFQGLYDAVYAISTDSALKMYHDQLLQDDMQPCKQPESDFHTKSVASEEDSRCNKLEHHFKELESLLHEAKDIKVNMKVGKRDG